jgi:hypothetical protein
MNEINRAAGWPSPSTNATAASANIETRWTPKAAIANGFFRGIARMKLATITCGPTKPIQ